MNYRKKLRTTRASIYICNKTGWRMEELALKVLRIEWFIEAHGCLQIRISWKTSTTIIMIIKITVDVVEVHLNWYFQRNVYWIETNKYFKSTLLATAEKTTPEIIVLTIPTGKNLILLREFVKMKPWLIWFTQSIIAS